MDGARTRSGPKSEWNRDRSRTGTQVRQDQNQDQDGINTKSTMRSGLGSEAGSVVNQDSNLSSIGIGIGKD